jgi:hypothetical protein
MLTADRKRLQKENHKMFGLTEEELAAIKVPDASNIAIYEIGNILQAKSKMSTVDKINHLIAMQDSLNQKFERMQEEKVKKEEAKSSAKKFQK